MGKIAAVVVLLTGVLVMGVGGDGAGFFPGPATAPVAEPQQTQQQQAPKPTRRNPGETLLVAKGGKGGRGNAAFKSHRNTAPKMSEKGEPGQKFELELELKEGEKPAPTRRRRCRCGGRKWLWLPRPAFRVGPR